MGKALEFVLAEPWAIQESSLELITKIASRTNEMTPEALAAKLGRPLDNTHTVSVRGKTAVLPIRGPIFRYANLFTQLSGATSLEALALDFRAAEEDPSVERIVLDIDSPGGHSAGISEFAAMIRASEMPVQAYVGNLGASAAYWIAAAADEVVVSDTAMLGSIGVVGAYRPNKSDEIKIVSSQSPLKQATPETEEGRVEAQRVVNELADVFIDTVAKYRGVSRDSVLSDFGRGGVLVGANTVTARMADRIGTLESIIASHTSENKPQGIMMSEDSHAPEITLAFVAEHHPEILTAAREEGAQQERDRIASVEAQSLPGHEKLISQLRADGKTTGEQAAALVIAAERSRVATQGAALVAETPEPLNIVGDDDAGGNTIDPKLPAPERCKQAWNKDPVLRGEFGDLETYVAFVEAEEAGRVRRIGGKTK